MGERSAESPLIRRSQRKQTRWIRARLLHRDMHVLWRATDRENSLSDSFAT